LDLERRVLLRMATSRDAGMTSDVLARARIHVFACADMTELTNELARGAAAVVVAEETLLKAELDVLVAALAALPPWSDPATLVLARQGADST
jgi:hypothetical protein